MISRFEERHIDGILRLWNSVAVEDGYKELNMKSFSDIFLSNPYFSPEITFALEDGGEICGFACGCVGEDLPLGTTSGYVTCVLLAERAQTFENFCALLERIESAFVRRGKKQAEVLFFNPMMLPWYIPDTPLHEHNNAPGAPVGSFFHRMLLQNGYFERARECAMYLDLKTFSLPGGTLEKERAAAQEGYEVTLFDAARHSGVEEMLHGFDNPIWQHEIADCTRCGVPVVVAARYGKVIGFAGPVIRQASGRGYFTGIGVHPEHEGKGLGSILFYRLCEAFQKIGAEYMSLYTGTTNPAIHIYQKAGFRPVREFAVLRKELQ